MPLTLLFPQRCMRIFKSRLEESPLTGEEIHMKITNGMKCMSVSNKRGIAKFTSVGDISGEDYKFTLLVKERRKVKI